MGSFKIKILLISISVFSSALSSASGQQDQHEAYTQEISNTDLQFDMVAIPGGEFTMGSPGSEFGRDSDEGPQHQVKISPFWMSKHEITWDLFEPFVYKDYEQTQNKGPISPSVDAITRPTKPYLDMTFGMGKESHPAVGMTQYAAIQFCEWLYARTGVFYRLPTEAEWEYACRSGTTTAYFFKNDASKLKEYAWYKANSNEETHPVGTKTPNEWGLYDMHGNVAEWTADQYNSDFYTQFEDKVANNPIAAPEKLYPHAIRGGSYKDEAVVLRSANRQASDPDWKRIDPQIPKSNWWFPEAPFIGFRIVRPLDPPSKEEIKAYYNLAPIPDYGY